MADASSGPVCFRISANERARLEYLAEAQGVTLSALARRWIMDVARAEVESSGGIEAVMAQAKRMRELRVEREAAAADRRAEALLLDETASRSHAPC